MARLPMWFLSCLAATAVVAACGGDDTHPQSAATNGAPPGRIVFENSRAIYAINDDGSGLSRIVTITRPNAVYALSPDGSRVAIEEDGRITVVNIDGSQPLTLAEDALLPVWSPDGSRIAFEARGALRVAKLDGSAPIDLKMGGTNPIGLAIWSPDGTRLAFQATGTGGLYVTEADGSGLTIVKQQCLGCRGGVSWSPDGGRLVFIQVDAVVVVNTDGTNEVRLANVGGAAWGPQWSPDGARIAFDYYDEKVGNEVFAIGSDGSNLVNLTHDKANDQLGAWSWDGKRILFESAGRHSIFGFSIMVMNADGSGVHWIVDDPDRTGSGLAARWLR